MHDVHRDSLIYKRKNKKKAIGRDPDHGHAEAHGHDTHDHAHDDEHHHDPDHGHGEEHSHGAHDHHHEHGHDHAIPHGHDHDHDEEVYTDHESDPHGHSHEHHGHEQFEDRAYNHMHEHGHFFYHRHHHTHHPEHTGVIHKIFKDPVRDWFGAALMGLLIVAGYLRWLPGHLSEGMIVCAAVIGIFPILKNALFECISRRRPSLELLLGALLVAGLFTGMFLETALVALFLLLGSFMKLNFGWRKD